MTPSRDKLTIKEGLNGHWSKAMSADFVKTKTQSKVRPFKGKSLSFFFAILLSCIAFFDSLCIRAAENILLPNHVYLPSEVCSISVSSLSLLFMQYFKVIDELIGNFIGVIILVKSVYVIYQKKVSLKNSKESL